MNADLCIICQETLGKPLIQVRLKGLETLIGYCEKKNSRELHKHLMEQLDGEKPNVKVHKDCLRDFTNAFCKPDLSIGVNNEGESSKSSSTLRSAGKECFYWKSNCFWVASV